MSALKLSIVASIYAKPYTKVNRWVRTVAPSATTAATSATAFTISVKKSTLSQNSTTERLSRTDGWRIMPCTHLGGSAHDKGASRNLGFRGAHRSLSSSPPKFSSSSSYDYRGEGSGGDVADMGSENQDVAVGCSENHRSSQRKQSQPPLVSSSSKLLTLPTVLTLGHVAAVPLLVGEDDANTNYEEFQKWHNGGGMFHKTACIESTALIEIGAVVHSECVIAANVHIGSGTIVGPAVKIGESTKVGYNVSLTNCIIGDACFIHNGVCIGQDGFGFFVDEHGSMRKKLQVDAECKDRESRGDRCKYLHRQRQVGHVLPFTDPQGCDNWRDTVIGDQSKIDNLVQIGHNVVIGKSCILCGQVGIAGSVTIGDHVTLGGRVAVRDHVSIVSKVRLAANSAVTKDIKESGDYGGFPAVPIHEWRKQVATLQTLKKWAS